MDDKTVDTIALNKAEAILSLLHHRGIVDSKMNREDVAEALTYVRSALGMGYTTYVAKPMPVKESKSWWRKLWMRHS